MKIEITGLGAEGEGVGQLKNGLKVFVEGALPGETAEVELLETKKNYALGSLQFLHEKSSDRVDPICPLFGTCGGCSIMHLRYEAQLKAKWQKVSEAFRRIGHLHVEVLPCRGSPDPLFYRNKVQMPLLWQNGKKAAGFYKKGSHDIVAVEKCWIVSPESEAIVRAILPYLQQIDVRYIVVRSAWHSKEALVILVTEGKQKILPFPVPVGVKGVVENINRGARNTILGKTWKTVWGQPFLHERLLGKTFKLSAGAFFQVNTPQAEQLYLKAIELAEIDQNSTVIDAYCGVGTISLIAAERAKTVIGVEENPQAIEDAKESATLNGSTNCTFYAGRTEQLLQKMKSPDVLFVNPPRKGCERSVLETAAKQKIKRIVYISCDPATLARDVALLVSLGYEVTHVEPFDMFPQTMHVETIVALKAPT